jgi:hypothetical protein
METKKTIKNKFDIAIQCLACYNQGRLTFYWKSIDKNTTLEDIYKSLKVETIHDKAKVKYLCGGDEYMIADSEDISIDEFAHGLEIFEYAQALEDVEDVDMIKAYREINHTIDLDSSDWHEFKDNVQVFNYLSDAREYVQDYAMEVYNFHEIDGTFWDSYISWDSVIDTMFDIHFWHVEIDLGYKDETTYNTTRHYVWNRY